MIQHVCLIVTQVTPVRVCACVCVRVCVCVSRVEESRRKRRVGELKTKGVNILVKRRSQTKSNSLHENGEGGVEKRLNLKDQKKKRKTKNKKTDSGLSP